MVCIYLILSILLFALGYHLTLSHLKGIYCLVLQNGCNCKSFCDSYWKISSKLGNGTIVKAHQACLDSKYSVGQEYLCYYNNGIYTWDENSYSSGIILMLLGVIMFISIGTYGIYNYMERKRQNMIVVFDQI